MRNRFYIVFLFLVYSNTPTVSGQSFQKLQVEAEQYLRDRGEVILEFNQPAPKVLLELSTFLSIDKVQKQTVQAYANKRGFKKFLTYSLKYRLISPPKLMKENSSSGKSLFSYDFKSYPDYQQYDSLMNEFSQNYPEICQLDTFGLSAEGRLLLAVKISDHVAMDEAEPECMYSSTIHGNETGGYVLMLRLIHYLLSNYGINSQVTALVDSLEIWINPLANPDGTYYSGDASVAGATRFNANAVDLNRNFPDPADGPHPDGNSYQPENVAMMGLLASRHFTISANFHAGEEVVNYPWDTWVRRHADDAWFQTISHEYADTVHAYSSNYMVGFNNGITNGYDWYSISGGREDYVTYFLQGRETTIELDQNKITPELNLDLLWEINFRSLLNYLREANDGIHGFITDSLTSAPVKALITIPGHDQDSSMVYSEPDSGFFVRNIEPGQYDLELLAPGYEPKTVHGIVVFGKQQTRLDIKLKPLTSVSNIVVLDQLNVFPNPTRGPVQLNFYLKKPQKMVLSLRNFNGKIQDFLIEKWYNTGWHREQIDLQRFPKGIYMLYLQGADMVFIRKIIKLGSNKIPKP